jgi:GT2 family glycosyltransferase
MTADSPLLSVVIVSWNRAGELKRCLRSVLEHTEYPQLEVIVVDNGSTDGSVDIVRATPSVKLIANDQNVGNAEARNQGLTAARGELVALLDNDIYVVDDVLGRGARVLLESPELGMIGAELRYPQGRRQHSAHRAMSIRLSLLQNLWLYRLLPRNRRAEVLLGGYWEEDRDIEVDWLTGAFLMLRRRLFIESGGCNPRLYPEDSEWCIRLKRAGHRILYAPRIGVVYHAGAVSDVWTDKIQLRRYHRAGLEAYRTLNGAKLAGCYRLAQLIGAMVRWTTYRAALALRPNAYFRSQVEYYGLLVDIYLRSNRNNEVG